MYKTHTHTHTHTHAQIQKTQIKPNEKRKDTTTEPGKAFPAATV
jgi:hypothetical protein